MSSSLSFPAVSSQCIDIGKITGTDLLIVLVVYLVLFFFAIYLVQKFLNKEQPQTPWSYWWLFLIFILSGIIVSIIFWFIAKAK